MLPPLPRCSGWAYSSLISPSRVSLPRKGRRVGLHIVLFEACSAFTRVAACPLALSPIRDTLIEGFSHFVTSMTAPIASGGSEFTGWGLHPLESAALPRRTPFAFIPGAEHVPPRWVESRHSAYVQEARASRAITTSSRLPMCFLSPGKTAYRRGS